MRASEAAAGATSPRFAVAKLARWNGPTGVAVGLVPRLGRGPLPEGVVAVPVTDPVPLRRVQLVWRRGRADSASLRTVREALETVAGS